MGIHRNLFVMILLLFLQPEQVFSQKPQVSVSFEVAQQNPFYERYKANMDAITEGVLDTLIKGLNRYIGFAEFIKPAAPNKLEIELNTKFLNQSSTIKEYYLFFNFINSDGTSLPHQWKFLSVSEFFTLGPLPEDVLDQLSRSWTTYLDGFYNLDLVSHMFQKLALPIPDSTHYFIDQDAGVHEAILPFRKEELRLNPEESVFEVIVIGKLSSGISMQEHQDEVHFSGFVEPPMPIPDKLMGCIRIGLDQLPLMKLLHGKVFIIRYQRKQYEDESDTDDFLNGI